ncbi:MAG: hypothetical protein CSA11_00095 [Chloroflexi bacterium]|nr:MAG: hypothetical protein CSA11_00095 [Chloroflexota bacterium]
MAQNKRTIKAEDLYRFQLVMDAQISPDGNHVILAVQRIDRKTEKKFANLWLVSTRGGRPQQFTYGDQVDTMPRWSPNGRSIAFLSNRKDGQRTQLYVIPLGGGEARPLTNLKGVIGHYSWSPDGKSLLCSVQKFDPAVLEREEDEQKKKLGVVARHITTRTFFKYDGVGYLPDERWHVWQVDAKTGKGKQLTESELFDEQMPAWSPDGKTIAFISNRNDEPDLVQGKDDVYLMPAKGGEFTKLDTPEGSKFTPVFSPNGRYLAFLGHEGVGQWWRNISVWVVPVDGSSPARNLTAHADIHCVDITSGDLGSSSQSLPTWSTDSSKIYFQGSQHGNTALYAVTVADEPEVERITNVAGVVGPVSFSANQDKVAFLHNTMMRPSELMLLTMRNGRYRQLTRFNETWLKRLHLGKVEEVWFKGKDGNDLQGWILFPPDFDPKKKYPSILEIHGGPQVQYGTVFMHEFFFLAAQGYVVYYSNPRGGQGYGEDHCKSIWNNWGTVDFDDVQTWWEFMMQKPYIDTERMGVTGGSYGGYMTSMIIGRSHQFKAAVSQRAVNNLVSMWGSSDFNWAFQQSIGENKPPFDNLEKYWTQSPMKYVGNAQTPTLVIHSEADYRVAQEQAEQLFVALKRLGVDTEMVLFPNEPHGLSRIGRTDRRIERLNHILRWFDKYLK